jgi:hypothetical protein
MKKEISMNSKKLVTMVVLGVLALGVAFGAVAYQSASAQTNTTPDAQASSEAATTAMPGKDGLRGVEDEYLAEALGITVDELNAADQKAQETGLAQAVEQGLITQAQADQIKASGRGLKFGDRRGGLIDLSSIDFNALLADALGISVEDLNAAQLQAQNARIDQAVADGKLTQEQADLIKGRQALYASEDFQASMKSAFEAAVAQAVTDGVITQAQADQILAENNARGFGMDFLGGHGFGGRGGHRR